MSIVRDIPTCAGLPLNMTVNAFGTHIIDSSFQSDLLLYMAKKSPTLSASVNPAVRLVVVFLHFDLVRNCFFRTLIWYLFFRTLVKLVVV